MQNNNQSDYLFRPKTIPINRDKIRNQLGQRRNDLKIGQLQIISRPRQNFFKLFFQRDKYIWIILHKHIKYSNDIETLELYKKFVTAFDSLKFSQNQLPICINIQQFKKWEKLYQCKVAVDQSLGLDIFKIIQMQNVVMMKVITSDVQLIKELRKNKFNYKVRGIDDNYDELINQIKQDMEKIKIQANGDKLQKVRLPNFMKLKIKDKAELIRYRNNIYCLINLSQRKSDMELSKRLFVEQSQKMYTSNKDKDAINYYSTYPFNDQEILRFYTQDCFFYRCLNNTLRIARQSEQFFIIGDPLNKMFKAIKNIYNRQFPYNQTRKGLKLYRGADLSPSETQYLQSCFGSFIQIHGFVSSTYDLQVAKKFARERRHNKIIQIVFDNINGDNPNITQNDFGFVNLQEISRFQEKQVLFNVLNIFKVIGKQRRGEFQFYTLNYGSIFNILAEKNINNLTKQQQLAYHTYKQLMAEREKMEDLGQLFLKSNQTQKSVDYYQAKIIQAKQLKKKQVICDFTIKKCQALILNGEPAKALQAMSVLISQRKTIKRSQNGVKFLEQVLNNKQQIMQEIGITKQYSQAGQSMDKLDQAESQLSNTNEALGDVLKDQSFWTFEVAYGQLQIKIQLAGLKQSVQSWTESSQLLKQSQTLAQEIVNKAESKDLAFDDLKKTYFSQTIIYQNMARISNNLEGNERINIQQLQQKYNRVQKELMKLVEQKSYDRSLIQIRKAQILRHREDFNVYKNSLIKTVMNSLCSIKSGTIDSQVPKTYHLLAQIQKSTHSLSSTQTAIRYLQKEYCTNTDYYTENDPRSMKTIIDIAQCQRDLKNSNQSIDLMKSQLKIIPFKNKPQHTVVSKILYTMGLSYLDLGEFDYALKCFEKGINLLRQILSPNQFNKYHYKYKIQLQLGRTLTFLLRYSQAEEHLNSYYRFVSIVYQNQHTDVANALNNIAILYMKWKRYTQSRRKFQESQQMFKIVSGEKSLVCAKINCNLGMIYSFVNQKNTALKYIDKARTLFDQIYFLDSQDKADPVHRESYMIQYYYAEIYKKFNDFLQAIQAYKKSILKLEDYKIKQKKLRQSNINKNISALSIARPSMIQTKKDHHELICRVKIIECQVKLKDYSFYDNIVRLIAELEKQIRFFSTDKNQKFIDVGKNGQLVSLHQFCKKLFEKCKNKDPNFKSNFKEIKFDVSENLEPVSIRGNQ